MNDAGPMNLLDRVMRFCLHQKLVVLIIAAMLLVWGVIVAPFDWHVNWLPRDPVPVDAIPDLGENQQIVFTEWMGRSPQDIEDQVTYPLTVALQGVPGVRTIRSFSYFGFSSIYVVFEDGVDFYGSRSRILEKLSSLPRGTLPAEVQPTLGPDATGLGQVFWYTLEGRDPDGQPIGGWDLDEIRAVQDYNVRYTLAGISGVAEVASVGGFVREYQVDLDPAAMRAAGVTLAQVYKAIQRSNLDVSAGSIEENHVEYLIRGLGFIKSLDDLRSVVVVERENTPITIAQIGTVALGPAPRRGVLDKNGAEAVGGVVTARFGENPLAAIQRIHAMIEEVSPGLPRKIVIDWSQVDHDKVMDFAEQYGIEPFIDSAQFHLNYAAWLGWLDSVTRDRWPTWITTSQLTLVPFYDRSELIGETLDTLSNALFQQVLVTMIVVIVMMMHWRGSLLVSAMMPVAVLLTFVGMKYVGVDANVVALAGIAIAIGTVVDVGIVLTENAMTHLQNADQHARRIDVIWGACREVSGAVLASVLTTVIGFLPVFTMVGREGKLFQPLAYTKTFVLIASVVVALTLLPVMIYAVMGSKSKPISTKPESSRFRLFFPIKTAKKWRVSVSLLLALSVGWILATQWQPLGQGRTLAINFLFVVMMVGGLLAGFYIFARMYETILRWTLGHKILFLSMPVCIVVFGLSIWLGWGTLTGWMPEVIKRTVAWQKAHDSFPGLGREFMPALDEGTFLFMPSLMPHASIGQATQTLQQLDAAIRTIPEIDQVVGKIGRADTSLDPAPISMVETIVHYLPEYQLSDEGERVRQWRDHIRSPDDIWREIETVTQIPGVTGVSKLQPIETRLIMLQTGMRASMGIKIRGPDLTTIESFGFDVEQILRKTAGVAHGSVNADRIVGTPYLEIDIDRQAISRLGINIADVQQVIEVAIGGRHVTTTVEGRERFSVRVRYMRELRDSMEALDHVVVSSADSSQHVPLSQVATVRYERGPRMIKSEDAFLTGYVTFGGDSDFFESEVIANARASIDSAIRDGALTVPAGISFRFTGSFENQARAMKTLMVVLPVSLLLIFIILYFQFGRVSVALIVFSSVAVAWSGGFLLIWAYNQPWFLNFELFGANMRDVFHVGPIKLSVAVWVGFLALFGIATDDGVIMATYLSQRFTKDKPSDHMQIREVTVQAGLRRIRPCLMTTATTILALLPVLTASGRGADIMLPMALPSVGGMAIAMITMFVVPVLYCALYEWHVAKNV